MAKTLCIYHANCADGLGAAWAVHRALGDEVEFVAAKYGEPPPREKCPTCKGTGAGDYSSPSGCTDCLGTGWLAPLHLNRDVLIVDFSYPHDTLQAMSREARSVLVIDHHKTAQKDLAELPPPYEGYFIPYGEWRAQGLDGKGELCPLAAIFDMGRSGAGLAWDYLHPGLPRPYIIDLIEDRDLWRFRLGDDTRRFYAALSLHDIGDLPTMLELLDGWSPRFNSYAAKTGTELATAAETILSEGGAVLRAHDQAVSSAVAASRRTMRIDGVVVPVANVPGAMASDAGHLLCQTQTTAIHSAVEAASHFGVGGDIDRPEVTAARFTATYYDGADGRRHFSLRSPVGGADVGAVAKRMAGRFNAEESYGTWAGGGHEHSAGFDAPIGWEGE